MSSQINIEGNTTEGIEFFVSEKGTPTARFTVIVNDRYQDKDRNWVSGPGVAYRVVAFYSTAENLANSDLTTKDSLFVIGQMKVHGWVDKDGNNRTERRIVADKVLYSFTRHTINANRVERVNAAPAADGWDGTDVPLNEPPF